MEKLKFKQIILLITYTIILFLALQNLNLLGGVSSQLITLSIPFIYGCVIAYLFHKPYNFFAQRVFKFKGNRALSIVCVYLGAFIIFSMIFSLLIPQLMDSIGVLTSELPAHYETLTNYFLKLFNEFEFTESLIKDIEVFFTQFLTSSLDFIYNAVPNILSSIIGITSSVTNFVFGLIISIYILSSKDTLCRQARQMTQAFLPEKYATKVLYVTRLSHRTFSNFISGQLVDAFILALLCFICMNIFSLPYALLISVIIGGSNIIPIFGPILGTIPTTFIILMANPSEPMTAVWFVVLIIVLQQIDSNIIYPRVVGGSIGLSGLWVIFAILIFGGQFGLVGMLVGVPICAIVYTLLRESTYKKLDEKGIPNETIKDID